jgi:hypothetical protein
MMFGQAVSKRRMLFAVAIFAITMLACNPGTFLASASTPTPAPSPTIATPVNIITNGVMAKDVSGDTYDPVGITDSFPADQSIFHAVVTISGAPDDTNFQISWLTASNKDGRFHSQVWGFAQLGLFQAGRSKSSPGGVPGTDFRERQARSHAQFYGPGRRKCPNAVGSETLWPRYEHYDG